LARSSLLRERRLPRTPAKPRLEREQPHRLIALLERYVPRRASGVAATVLLLLGSALFGVVKGGHLEDLTSALSDTRNAIANSAGFGSPRSPSMAASN
jgi:cell division protein FtsQ